MWCWRDSCVPWTARKSSQSILKKINPEYSLEGLTLKIKLQYFGHLMQRASSLEKSLILGKIEGERRRGQQKRWLDSTTDSMDMNLSKLWETVGDSGVWWATVLGGCKVLDTNDLETEQLKNILFHTFTWSYVFSQNSLFKKLYFLHLKRWRYFKVVI